MSSLSTYACQETFFTPAELERIERLGDSLLPKQATTNAQQLNAKIRVSRVAWINPDPQHRELFARIGALAQHVNAHFFNFAIDEMEPLQYTVYESGEGGHYGWHMDSAPSNPKPRKLSFSLQLSDPTAYEGCDLEFSFGDRVRSAPRTRGATIAFPSFFWHRVTPVTKGTRKALVMWACGPAFR